jgi:hypothetical protein
MHGQDLVEGGRYHFLLDKWAGRMQALLHAMPDALGGAITASYESIADEFFLRFNDKK